MTIMVWTASLLPAFFRLFGGGLKLTRVWNVAALGHETQAVRSCNRRPAIGSLPGDMRLAQAEDG